MKLSDALKLIKNEEENNIINNYENVCLISKEKIKNKITLNCNHNFEYLYLYKEILQSTKNKYKNINYINGFSCPYCRFEHKYFLPYNNNISELNKIIDGTDTIAINKKFKNEILKCTCILKSGKNKGSPCNKQAHYFGDEILCMSHYKNNIKNKKICNNKKCVKEQCSKILKNGNQCKNKMHRDNLCKLHYKLLNANN